MFKKLKAIKIKMDGEEEVKNDDICIELEKIQKHERDDEKPLNNKGKLSIL